MLKLDEDLSRLFRYLKKRLHPLKLPSRVPDTIERINYHHALKEYEQAKRTIAALRKEALDKKCSHCIYGLNSDVCRVCSWHKFME